MKLLNDAYRIAGRVFFALNMLFAPAVHICRSFTAKRERTPATEE